MAPVVRVLVPLNNMCSRMCDIPAPSRSSSLMLPVAHQACTLATGALRSSCTIIVRPLGKTHLTAVVAGKVTTAESSFPAVFNFAFVIMKPTQPQQSDQTDYIGFGAGKLGGRTGGVAWGGSNGLTNTSSNWYTFLKSSIESSSVFPKMPAPIRLKT